MSLLTYKDNKRVENNGLLAGFFIKNYVFCKARHLGRGVIMTQPRVSMLYFSCRWGNFLWHTGGVVAMWEKNTKFVH